MKIGIDISQTAFKGTGVARYTQGLIRSLLSHNHSKDDTYSFLYTSLRQKPSREIIDMIQPPHRLVTYPFPPTLTSYLWNTLHVFPIEWLLGSQDVYISSDWTQPPTNSAKKLTIIHDMIPYLFPETSTTDTKLSISSMNISPNIVATHKKRLSWVKRECDHVITDSYSTKKDIVQLLGIPEKKISVVYPAVNTKKVSAADQDIVRKEYSLRKPYILTVGKVEPRKNIARLIKAFIMAKLYEDMDLVIVGAQGWGQLEHIDIPAHAKKSLKFLGYVSEEHLGGLYSCAEIFAMPSLYEGFGYPVIEAMSYGTPVACSNTSSLGELVKGYGVLFNPIEVDSIAESLTKLHAQPSLRKANVKKAHSYAKTFTSKRFADELTKILESIV